MSTQPLFATTIISAAVNIATANPNRDGTGTVGTLYTAPANGARIDEIKIKAKVTTTAGMIRIFLHSGTAYFLLAEVLVTAITASATVAAFETSLYELGLVLKSGWSIRVATEKAESFDISIVRGGEF
jgi:hypothetical protein